MIRYETLILAAPEITADESSALEKQFEQLIKKARGQIRSFERWGKYKLAYPVRNNEYGIYFLVRFELENSSEVGQLLKDIDAFFAVKNNAIVMRHMITKLHPNQPLTYVKPESLEDIPSQDVEQKMKGILHVNSNSNEHEPLETEHVEMA